MKQRELTQRLENGGFVFERHGAGHDIYVRGTQRETVPSHKEINEQLARAILRRNGLL